jgi:hypothetical protein
LIDLSYSTVFVPGEIPTVAVVPLQVILNYHSFVLDIDLAVVFTYNVALTTGDNGCIPTGYQNTCTPALGINTLFPASPVFYPPFGAGTV